MSQGLKDAGFELLFAFDKDPKAVETHSSHFSTPCEVLSIENVSGDEILRRIGLTRGALPLLAGGPPCQGFSKQKRGAHLGDDRNRLVMEFIRLVNELSPRFLLFENVAIFGQKRGEQYVEAMHGLLGDKWDLTPHFYNSADYGLAQTRERFIVVGSRKDQDFEFSIPEPTVTRWATVGEIIGDLPEPPTDYSDHPDYPNHQNARVTPKNIERFSYVPQGGGWRNIPRNLQLECHRHTDITRGGWPDVYGRLELDGQCPTITGGFDSFTRGRYGDPLRDRPLTARSGPTSGIQRRLCIRRQSRRHSVPNW